MRLVKKILQGLKKELCHLYLSQLHKHKRIGTKKMCTWIRDCSIHGNLAFKRVFQEEKMMKKLKTSERERKSG